MTKDPIQQGLATLSIIVLLVVVINYLMTQTASDSRTIALITLVFAGLIYTTFQIKRNANNPEARKIHGRYGIFYLLLFFLMLPLTFISLKKEGRENQEAEQKKWEDPQRYHYIILPERYTDASVSLNGQQASGTSLENEGKTIKFFVAPQYTGKESNLEVHLRSDNGQISSYSKKVVLNAAPDTITITE